MVEEYTPKPSLVALHSAVRILGVSELPNSLLQDFETLDQSSALAAYATGLAVPAVCMVLVYLVWACALLCQKTCKRMCCPGFTASQQAGNQFGTLGVFSAFCLTSIVAWGVGIQANIDATVGFSEFLVGVRGLVQFVQRAVGEVDSTRQVVSGLAQLAGSVVQQCGQFGGQAADAGVVQQPFEDALQAIDGVQPGLVSQVSDVTSTIASVLVEVDGYVYWREQGTLIVLVCLVVLLTFFWAVTVLRVLHLHPEHITTRISCLVVVSKTASWAVFVVGVVLLLVAWVFLALIHVMATLGSDLCVPDVDANLARLVLPFVSSNSTVEDNVCGAASSSSPAEIRGLCFYQSCTGDNPAEAVLDQIPNVTSLVLTSLPEFSINDMVQHALPGFNLTLLEGYNLTTLASDAFNVSELADVTAEETQVLQNFTQCASALHAFLDSAVHDAQHTSAQVLGLLDCEDTIHPMYAALLYRGLCNGFVHGLYNAYVSFLVGATCMMMAFSVYRVIEFGDVDGRMIPTAVDVVEHGDDDNGGDRGDDRVRSLQPRQVEPEPQYEDKGVAHDFTFQHGSYRGGSRRFSATPSV